MPNTMSKNGYESSYTTCQSAKSARNIPSRRLERKFWRFYDDVSKKFLTVLRYTFCLPLFYKFPENNFKVTRPDSNDYDYGDSVRSRPYGYYKRPSYDPQGFELRRPSSIFSVGPRSVSNCSVDTPEEVKHKKKRRPKKHRPLIHKILNRRKKRRPPPESEEVRNNIVFVKTRRPGHCRRTSSIRSIDRYSVTSSIDDLPNVYNDFGDGPQNKERLRRITDFFNDIYIEQQKLLMKH